MRWKGTTWRLWDDRQGESAGEKVLQESRRRRCWMVEWGLRRILCCKLEGYKCRGGRRGKGVAKGRQKGQGRLEGDRCKQNPFENLEYWKVIKHTLKKKNQRASNALSSTLCLSSDYLYQDSSWMSSDGRARAEVEGRRPGPPWDRGLFQLFPPDNVLNRHLWAGGG